MSDNFNFSSNMPSEEELTELCERYGTRNVERAMIFIVQQRHPQTDLYVLIPRTRERIEAVLEAVHGEFLDADS